MEVLAVGTAVGMGFLWPALCVVILAILTLTVVGRLERQIKPKKDGPPDAERTE
jgi:uncharacterized membrane protein YhiD involved in acid resistance